MVNDRLAHEKLRHVMNDDRRRLFGDSGRPLALVCECGDPTCRRTVVIWPQEYDARQPGPILHADHSPAS